MKSKIALVSLIGLIIALALLSFSSRLFEWTNLNGHKLFKRNAAAIDSMSLIKNMAKNLQNGQEIVISNGMGFQSNGNRFKSGDIHIKKGNNNQKPIEISESSPDKYSYPFGIGAFLMSGCYLFTGGLSSSIETDDGDESSSSDQQQDSNDQYQQRFRRELSASKENDMKKFCARFSRQEKTIECQKIIPGSYVLGSGFDIKYENNENSRRKSLITRYCNYKKSFKGHSIPDIMTANGIYDTKTQTMAFDESNEYMKYVATKSNLDRYLNIFSSDMTNAYGGVNGQKNVQPGTSGSNEKQTKVSNEDTRASSRTVNSDYMLFSIQSNILIYELLLDQIKPNNIDPQFLVDFLNLPNSYFGPNAQEKFDRFIARYGTHVAVSAKFGGEFKIMHTSSKTKETTLEKFAQQSTEDSMRMFSRAFNLKSSMVFVQTENDFAFSKTNNDNKKAADESKSFKNANREYSNTYMSVKGGSQEVASIVANMNQPDFSDSFIAWLQTVEKYPRAFDFKYESITSILDINPALLFADMDEKDASQKFCTHDSGDKSLTSLLCKNGVTIDEFGESWRRKLKALQFAITIYLKEKNGLKQNKFFIEKGETDCRFNIIDYISPFWSEIINGNNEYHLTLSLSEDEHDYLYSKPIDDLIQTMMMTSSNPVTITSNHEPQQQHSASNMTTNIFLELNIHRSSKSSSQILTTHAAPTGAKNSKLMNEEFGFKLNDEIYFIKRDEFWLSKRKGDIFTYKSAKLLNEPFKTVAAFSSNQMGIEKFWINIFGLVIEYNQNDSTITVVNMKDILDSYSNLTDCYFELKDLENYLREYNRTRNFKNLTAEFHDATINKYWPTLVYVPDKSAASFKTNELKIAKLNECRNKFNLLKISTKSLKNLKPFWIHLWNKVIGVIDYADPMQAIMHTWDIKYAMFPCKLKWSNNLMMMLPKDTDQGKCLTFVASTDGEIFVVIATTPSDRNTWYLFHINLRGIIFYRAGQVLLLNQDPAAGTVGDKDVYQKFFICLNYEKRNRYSGAGGSSNNSQQLVVHGLYIQYGLIDDSIDKMRLYMSYFDVEPLEPIYYSFGSRDSNVEILDAHLEMLEIDDQIKLRCSSASKTNKAFSTTCDYKCHSFCDGCFQPYSQLACKKCSYASIFVRNLTDDYKNYNDYLRLAAVDLTNATGNISGFICLEKCPPGYSPDPTNNNLCMDVDECLLNTNDTQTQVNECQINTYCVNTVGSYNCVCNEGFEGNNLFCEDIDECELYLHNCSSRADCMNLYGSFRCDCKPGYHGDGYECADLNECELNLDECAWNQKCVNVDGSHLCVCKAGFKMGVNSGVCQEVFECEDEEFKRRCEAKRGFCVLISNETNGIAYEECLCPDGYQMFNGSCVDINECNLADTECNRLNLECVNTAGSYHCKCRKGFYEIKQSSGNTTALIDCKDIDECLIYDSACSDANSVCQNLYGGYECICKPGYYKSGHDDDGVNGCIDVNECHLSKNYCSSIHNCFNTNGSFVCVCPEGFELLDSNKCSDIDECQLGMHDCKLDGLCRNTPGSYYCECKDSECSDEDGDLLNANCKWNANGNRICSCDNGFEQKINDDGNNQNSYSHGLICQDVDECSKYESICGDPMSARCVNEYGSFRCECQNGFVPVSNSIGNIIGYRCEDIDECSDECLNDCDPVSSTCSNLPGSYTCKCRAGFSKINDQTCVDVNECETGEADCDPATSTCFNLRGDSGKYECKCNQGFVIHNDISRCEDLNECVDLKMSENCSSLNAECLNMIGSYRCECLSGFRREDNDENDKIRCVDIDECAESVDVCEAERSTCVNEIGSYTCKCKRGYIWSLKESKCVDLDECKIDNKTIIEELLKQNNDQRFDPCDEHATCLNTVGSFECVCNQGWQKQQQRFNNNNNNCVDVNECKNETLNKCARSISNCINLLGSYDCKCKQGFIGDGFYCDDIDECAAASIVDVCNNKNNYNGNNQAHLFNLNNLNNFTNEEKNFLNQYQLFSSVQNHYDCLNTIGSYKCICKSGFLAGSNNECVDVNECEKYHPCNENSVCENTVGSFRCDCLPGFSKLPGSNGSGSECVDLDECNSEWTTNKCDRNAKCTNTFGSYNCTCLDGFDGDGFKCIDIDECSIIENADMNVCNSTGKCVNTIGSFKCDCFQGYINPSNETNRCVDLDECEYTSCFGKEKIDNETCYAFGLCHNFPGSFTCECFAGFRFDRTKGHCVDIDECEKLEHELNITRICALDDFKMASCVNTCGNYTCACRDTNDKLIDIYDSSKCYKRNQVRDFTVYVYLSRIHRDLKVSRRNFSLEIVGCRPTHHSDGEDGQHRYFYTQLDDENYLNEYLLDLKEQHWFPIFIDNSNWSSIEFVCGLNLMTSTALWTTDDKKLLLKQHKNNQLQLREEMPFMMLEDLKRKRCSLFVNISHSRKKSAIGIGFKLRKVWDLNEELLNCEESLDMDDSDKKWTQNTLNINQNIKIVFDDNKNIF